MTEILRKKTGKPINKKRTRRLMKELGLYGIIPKRKLTRSVKFGIRNEVIDKKIAKPNQVWVSDITYIRVKDGYAYGVSIMDQYSRKMMSYEISNTVDEGMYIHALENAIKETKKHGVCEILHTSMKSQYIGRVF